MLYKHLIPTSGSCVHSDPHEGGTCHQGTIFYASARAWRTVKDLLQLLIADHAEDVEGHLTAQQRARAAEEAAGALRTRRGDAERLSDVCMAAHLQECFKQVVHQCTEAQRPVRYGKGVPCYEQFLRCSESCNHLLSTASRT